MKLSGNGVHVNFRPMAVIASGVCVGIVLARELQGVRLSWVVCLFLGVLALILALKKVRRILLFICAVLLAFTRTTAAYPAMPAEGCYELRGKICETPCFKNGKHILVLNNTTLNGLRMNGRILLQCEQGMFSYEYGDIIAAEGSLTAFSSNKKGFNEFNHYISQGITARFECKTVNASKTGNSFDFYGFFLRLRAHIENTVSELFGDYSDIVSGMLLGDKSNISASLMDAFRRTGTAHLFAVSGLHVSIFVAFFMVIIPKRRPWLRVAVIGIFLLLYCALTAFAPSLVRASVMSICLISADPFARRYDSLSALSLAFVIITAFRPFALLSIGFQLSFCTVFTILLLNKPIVALMKNLHQALSGVLSVAICGTIGSLPLSAHYFNSLPLLGIFANIIIVPLAPLILVPSAIAVAAYIVSPKVAQIAALAAVSVLRLTSEYLYTLSSIRFCSIDVPSPSLFSVLTLFVPMFVVSPYFICGKKRKAIYALTAFAAATLLIVLSASKA